MGGVVPKFVSRFLMARQLEWSVFLQSYFLKQRELKELDEKDGEALGEAYFFKISDIERRAAVGHNKAPEELFRGDRDVRCQEFQVKTASREATS